MRLLRSRLAAPVSCAIVGASIFTLAPAANAEEWIGRSVTLGGHKLNCNNAQIMVDRTLPSEGGAGDDFVILNPDMLKNQPETVRIFVFKHECGHLTVGDSELKADCFAVQQGVREHWLDRKGLDQVCQSFDGAPETDTHPSAERRCRNLDQCYAAALATEAKTNPPGASPAPASVAAKPAPAKKTVAAAKPPATKAAAAAASQLATKPAFKTTVAKVPAAKPITAPAAAVPSVAPTPPVEAPPVIATGSTPNAAIPPGEVWGVPVNDETADAAQKAVSSWRCTEPLRVSDAGGDGIAHLIGEDAKTAAGCR
jgi:pyruvate/2-oxoglutarate dehydrogenase complex dihydrolipoamide acyltransferase (E2) component